MKIVYMDGYDEVRDADTQSNVIFSTKLPNDLVQWVERDTMDSKVVEQVVTIWNQTNDLQVVDEYLLDADCSQDEREIIVEALYHYK